MDGCRELDCAVYRDGNPVGESFSLEYNHDNDKRGVDNTTQHAQSVIQWAAAVSVLDRGITEVKFRATYWKLLVDATQGYQKRTGPIVPSTGLKSNESK